MNIDSAKNKRIWVFALPLAIGIFCQACFLGGMPGANAAFKQLDKEKEARVDTQIEEHAYYKEQAEICDPLYKELGLKLIRRSLFSHAPWGISYYFESSRQNESIQRELAQILEREGWQFSRKFTMNLSQTYIKNGNEVSAQYAGMGNVQLAITCAQKDPNENY